MEKLIDKYRPADYEDCFSRTLIGGERMKPRDLLELVFVRYPEPVSWLMKLRNVFVKPFVLKAGGGFADMVIEENETELVMGKRDKHLDFYIVLECEPPLQGRQCVSISTLVNYNNCLGRIYFFVIRLFHVAIVKSLAVRAARIWSREHGEKYS
mgnify:FL=1